MNLGYILPSDTQMLSHNGKPLTGGHVEVYMAGTDEKYITYCDFDGTVNPFSILIPSDGRLTVLGDNDLSYDYYVYDSHHNLVFSRKNVHTNESITDGSVGVSQLKAYKELVPDNKYVKFTDIDGVHIIVSLTDKLQQWLSSEGFNAN